MEFTPKKTSKFGPVPPAPPKPNRQVPPPRPRSLRDLSPSRSIPPNPSPQQSGLHGLKSLSEARPGLGTTLIESRDLWFNKKIVTLTGYKFTNCRFDGCELYVQSDNFELENCFISSDTVIKYSESSLRVLKIFNKDSEAIRNSMPNFAATKNDDGTITIR